MFQKYYDSLQTEVKTHFKYLHFIVMDSKIIIVNNYQQKMMKINLET